MQTAELRIRDVQARPVLTPLAPPIRTASGSVTQAPLLLIDLTTEEGVVGRSYLFGYQSFTLGPLRDLVRALGETIKGEPVAPLDLDRTLRGRLTLFGTRGLQGMALSGLDMAAWDAQAVAAGMPLAALLGGRPRPIPASSPAICWPSRRPATGSSTSTWPRRSWPSRCVRWTARCRRPRVWAPG